MKFKFSILVAGALAGLLCVAAGCARVDELDNRVTDLEKKMADLEGTQIASLAQQVQALNAFKDDLTNLDVKGTYSGLLSDMNQAKADIASILANMVNQNDFTALLNTVNGLTNDVKKIKDEDIAAILSRLGATESDINAAKSAISGLTEAINSANAKIAALEGIMAEERLAALEGLHVGDRLAALEGLHVGDRLAALEGLNAAERLAALEGIAAAERLAILEEAVGTIGPKVTALLERVGVAEEKIKENADEIAKIKEGLKKAQEDIEKLDQRITAAEGDINQILSVTIPAIQARITEQVDRLDAAIKDVNTSLADFKKLTNETIATMQDAIGSLDLRVLGLETSLKGLTAEVAEHYKQVLANTQAISDNAADIAAIKEDLHNHLNRIKNLEVKAGEIESICTDLQNQINSKFEEVKGMFKDYVMKETFDRLEASVYTKIQIDEQVAGINQKIAKNTEDIIALSEKVDSIAAAHDSSLEELLGITGGLGEDIEALKKADTVLFKNVKAIWGKLWDLKQANEALNNEIDGLKTRVSDLEAADIELSEGLTEAVDSIVSLRSDVTDIQGDVAGLHVDVAALQAAIATLPEDVRTFSELLVLHGNRINAISDSVKAVTTRVDAIEGRLVDVEDLLEHRIQSLVYVPDYRDGKITIYTEVLKAGNTEINLDDVTTDIMYQVKPARLADTLVNAWTAKTLNVSFDAARVETRGEIKGVIAFDAIKDVKVTDPAKGIITITVDPNDSTVANGYAKNSAIALVLSDEKGNSRTTEYTNTTTKGGQSYEIVFQYAHTYPDSTVSMPYNKTDVATFFGTVEPLFRLVPKGASTGEAYTIAQLAALGHNIAPYVGVANEVIYPEDNKTNFVVADDSTTVSVNLISDKTKTALSVGDTLKVIKKMYVKGAIDTCKAKGFFAVTPISLYADLSATLEWNLAENWRGDIYTNACGNVLRAFQFNGPNKDIEVELDSTNVQSESGFGPDVFSHLDPLAGSVAVVKVDKDGQKVALEGDEFTKFMISNIRMAGTATEPKFKIDVKGFDFTAKQYIVSAKYLPVYEGQVSKDTTTVRLFIDVVDRDRDMIVEHTYPTQTLDVTKDFGGKVRIHLQKEGAEWEYFSALLDSLDQPSTLKFADFTENITIQSPAKTLAYALVDENNPKGYDDSRLELVCNNADSITFDVNYSVDDIEGLYATGFSVKDTITLGAGQKVAIEIPFALNWPVYDFKHNEYWVAQNAETGKYYSQVEPYYELGGQPVEATSPIDKFDVQLVDVKKCFDIVDENGAKVTPADLGLTVSYEIAEEPEHEGVTMDGSYNIRYHGAVDSVIVKGTLTFDVNGTPYKLATSFDTVASVAGKYAGYYVKKFDPFKAFTQTETPSVTVNAPMKYSFNIREYMSLTDSREFECLDYTTIAYPNSYWVIGDGTNGFATGANAKVVYGIGDAPIHWDAPGAPEDIKNKIELSGNTLSFDNTGEVKLMKDVTVTLDVTFTNDWGEYTLPMSFLFKAPQK